MSELQSNLRAIFGEALDRKSASERAAYLDEACHNHPELRERVEALLRAHASAGGFLSEPAGAPETADDESSRQKSGAGPTVSREGVVNLSMAELRSLLHYRLVIITIIMFVGGCILHGVRWFRYFRDMPDGVFASFNWHHWVQIVTEASAVLLAGALLVFLKIRSAPTLRTLRSVELLICAAIIVDLLTGLSIFLTITAPQWTDQGLAFDVVRLMFRQSPQAFALEWFILLVGYGMLIPNTGRRCTAVVGAMVLCAALASVLLYLGADPQQRMLQLDFFARFGTYLGVAAGVAIFGSHRLESLRREAIEARQLGQYQLKRRVGAGGRRSEHSPPFRARSRGDDALESSARRANL
jgi:eukaryotic-like serine/threonine-protein kinase